MTHISVTPRATEKAYRQVNSTNTYVFNVPLTANKQQIADAVETQFDVKVVGVTSTVQSGKAVRYSRGKRTFPGTTNRKDTKKAYVCLDSDSSIDVFESPTDNKQETK